METSTLTNNEILPSTTRWEDLVKDMGFTPDDGAILDDLLIMEGYDSDGIVGTNQMDFMAREINEEIWSLDSCSLHSFDSANSHYSSNYGDQSGSDLGDDDAVDLTPLVLSHRREFARDTLILTQHKISLLRQFQKALCRHVSLIVGADSAKRYGSFPFHLQKKDSRPYSVIETDPPLMSSQTIHHDSGMRAVFRARRIQKEQCTDMKTLLNSCYDLYICLQHYAGIEDPEDYILQWNIEDEDGGNTERLDHRQDQKETPREGEASWPVDEEKIDWQEEGHQKQQDLIYVRTKELYNEAR